MTTTLEAMADEMKDFAAHVIAPGVDFDPMLRVVDKAGDNHIIAVGQLFEEPYDRWRPAMLRTILADADAVAYVLACEAWTVAVPAGAEPERPPSEDDRRVSALMVSGETVDGETLLFVCPITEGKNRRRLELDRGERLTPNHHVEGRMFGLLERRPSA